MGNVLFMSACVQNRPLICLCHSGMIIYNATCIFVSDFNVLHIVLAVVCCRKFCISGSSHYWPGIQPMLHLSRSLYAEIAWSTGCIQPMPASTMLFVSSDMLHPRC